MEINEARITLEVEVEKAKQLVDLLQQVKQLLGEIKLGSKNQREQVIDALTNFTVRVARGDVTSEAEITVLPAIAALLLNP